MASKRLEAVECRGVEKKTVPSKHHVFVLLVSWSDGSKCAIYRRYSSFFDFLSLLKEQVKDNVQLPDLPAYSKFIGGVFLRDAIMDKRKKIIEDFCQHILRLPPKLISSRAVVDFFETWESDSTSLAEGYNGTENTSKLKGSASPRLLRKAQKVLGFSHEDIKIAKRKPGRTSPNHEDHQKNNNVHPSLNRQNGVTHDDRNKRDNSPPIERKGDNSPLTSNTNVFDEDNPLYVDSAMLASDTVPKIRRESEDDIDVDLPKYSAISSFKSRKSSEVDLHEGSAVRVLEKSITGWWFVAIEGTERQGWAPGAFLEPVNLTEEEEEEELEEIIGHCKTVSDYTAQSHDEVSCKCGEEVDVLSTNMDGWWKVRCQGKVGYIPVACLDGLEMKQSDKVNFLRHAMSSKSIYRKAPPPRRQSAMYRPVPEFGSDSSSDEETTSTSCPPRPKKSTIQYTQVVFDEEKEIQIEDDDISKLYAKVIKPKKQQLVKKDTPVLYAHINPQSLAKDAGKGDVPTKDTNTPNHSYVNVKITGTKLKLEDELFQVLEDYTPHISSSYGLAVKRGDVVKVVKQEGLLRYCIRCLDDESDKVREGWLPHDILTGFTTDSPITIASSHVPIVPIEIREQALKSCNDLLSATANQVRRLSCDPPAPPKAPSPRLHHREIIIKEEPSESVPIMAKCSYSADTPGTLPFIQGESGLLLDVNPLGWWLISLGGLEGWVPGDYWEKVERPKVKPRQQVEAPSPQHHKKLSQQPWFFGKIDRHECESMLIRNADNRDYLVRESKNRIGDFTLSVLYEGRVRHFPIKSTESGKFFIGNHHYPSLTEVIQYYQMYTLFHSETGLAVMLGKPLAKR